MQVTPDLTTLQM